MGLGVKDLPLKGRHSGLPLTERLDRISTGFYGAPLLGGLPFAGCFGELISPAVDELLNPYSIGLSTLAIAVKILDDKEFGAFKLPPFRPLQGAEFAATLTEKCDAGAAFEEPLVNRMKGGVLD